MSEDLFIRPYREYVLRNREVAHTIGTNPYPKKAPWHFIGIHAKSGGVLFWNKDGTSTHGSEWDIVGEGRGRPNLSSIN